MSPEEIVIVNSPEVRKLISDNIGRPPAEIALDKALPYSQIIATQVKYLSKARKKLPSYFSAGCIIPPRAFEQSSSEETARVKDYGGDLCVDLTGGLGVDSYYFSKKFKKVITVEQDWSLAEIARINFGLLGASNIEVVNCSAEQFLSSKRDLKADLVYIDPDRRNEAGERKILLSECRPDVVSLLPYIKEISQKILIKLSPLFDVDAVFTIFGSKTKTEVLSLGNECKEVLAELDDRVEYPVIKATAIGKGGAEYPYPVCLEKYSDTVENQVGEILESSLTSLSQNFEKQLFLVVPDVALVKSRTGRKYFYEKGAFLETENSFAFTQNREKFVMGSIYSVNWICKYNPRLLKKTFKSLGITRLNILKRDFPFTNQRICKELGIKEGGNQFAALTTISGKLTFILLSDDSPITHFGGQ